MADPQVSSRKRKRSSAACRPCHNRKVRCNILVQGTPCSNCQQDGSHCEVYMRSIGLPNQPSSEPQTSATTLPNFRGSSPLPSSTRDISIRGIIEGVTPNDHIVHTSTYTQHNLRFTPTRESQRSEDPSTLSSHGFEKDDFMPYYAGESEGLEFLFDQCNPDRRDRGPHYITPRKTYRHKRLVQGARRLAPRLPHRAIQQELVKCFFHYVWPVMPIINAKDFLEAFENDMSSISPLLLWSVFFSALSYVDDDLLKWNKLKPRKVLKEKYYQAAKDIYDRQEEEDKTVLIQSALLLAMWYVDLEDRDGSWFWVGTAISLCHTIGLHRASTYSSMTPVPFPSRLRRLWRRIWWATFYRECWLAMGFGRPVRAHFDDCDEEIPTKDEVMEDVRALPDHLRQQYLPSDVDVLIECGVVLVSLGIMLNEILVMHYRPRSTLPTPAILFKQEADIKKLRITLPTPDSPSSYTTVHRCHFEMYFNSVLITLYRPYLAHSLEQMSTREEAACREQVIQRARKAAADTTSQVNKLMAMNAIDQSPSGFMAATMSSMQVLVFELRTSSRLGRGYAKNQLELHMLVLSHLRKTYWTADVQHNIFMICLRTLENDIVSSSEDPTPPLPESHNAKVMEMGPPRQMPLGVGGAVDSADMETMDPDADLATTATATSTSYDDDLTAFMPFVGLPSYSDELGASDWDISDSVSLDSIHSNQ